jgi:hypothetical protein
VILAMGQSWHSVGPALIFVPAGVSNPHLGDWPVYLAALASMFVVDAAVSAFAEHT